MSKNNRCQIFVDNKVQGALIWRIISYWFYCLLSVSLLVVCWSILTGPRQTSTQLYWDLVYRYGPALIASVIVLPIVLIDATRFSNRFVGPVVRLRRALKEWAEGEQVEPIKFRKDDFWCDFADNFNRAVARNSEPPVLAEFAEEEDQKTADLASFVDEPV